MFLQPTKSIDIQHVTYGINSTGITTVNPYDTHTLLFENTVPGAFSKVLAVQLTSTKSKVISNIKLGVVDIGSLSWADSLLTYELLDFYNESVSTKNNFEGVNSNASAGSIMNISAGNITSTKSKIVHLRLNLPESVLVQQTCMIFKWFFEYS